MKKSNLLFAVAVILLGYVGCKKSDSSTTTTTTSTTSSTSTTGGNNTKVPAINQIVINDTIYDVGVHPQPQSGADFSFYADYADTAQVIELRVLFNPIPDSTKTYNVISGAPVNQSGNTQLTLTYDPTTMARAYNAVSGGTVSVITSIVAGDSTYMKFTNVTFKKQGAANKVVSGYIGSPNQ